MACFTVKPKSRADRIDRLVQAARQGTAEQLSGAARARILEESLKPGFAEPLPSLFTPARRLVAAGALPVALAGALLLTLDRGVERPPDALERTRVAVSKEGESVLFAIQNGGRAHTVHRSSDPRGTAGGRRVEVTGGAYVESLQDQASLVFYRIE